MPTITHLPRISNGGVLGNFVLDITFDASQSGKPFIITADDYLYDDIVPESSRVQVGVPSPNTTYTIVCNANRAVVTTTEYFKIYPVQVYAIPELLSDATWDQIGYAANLGFLQDVYSIGDEKDITLTTGETLTLQIYDFNHDSLFSGGSIINVTFGLKNLLKDTRSANTSNANTGLSSITDWLNNSFYNTLPTDLKAVIKISGKRYSAGNQSTTINTQGSRVFLMSEVECFGTASYSVIGEGTQYPIFTNNASRIKRFSNGSGSATNWWTRSPHASNATNYCYVNLNGAASATTATSTYGVCFGFCGFCV